MLMTMAGLLVLARLFLSNRALLHEISGAITIFDVIAFLVILIVSIAAAAAAAAVVAYQICDISTYCACECSVRIRKWPA